MDEANFEPRGFLVSLLSEPDVRPLGPKETLTKYYTPHASAEQWRADGENHYLLPKQICSRGLDFNISPGVKCLIVHQLKSAGVRPLGVTVCVRVGRHELANIFMKVIRASRACVCKDVKASLKLNSAPSLTLHSLR